MMNRRHDEEENMVALYEASLNGCVSTLNTLIRRDPLILYKVSLTSLCETPLHIATLLGHLDFCKVLICKNPKLAEEVDSLGRTPFHLASAEGHTEIVQALLQANVDVCLAHDQDGRIPLHLAAMRGRIDVIEELIIARRESIRVNLDGESVLHLCVRYNHLDALKLLVLSANCEELFLSSKDHDGNSILHLAVMLKQMKVR
jgi:ankyrin repeat protein